MPARAIPSIHGSHHHGGARLPRRAHRAGRRAHDPGNRRGPPARRRRLRGASASTTARRSRSTTTSTGSSARPPTCGSSGVPRAELEREIPAAARGARRRGGRAAADRAHPRRAPAAADRAGRPRTRRARRRLRHLRADAHPRRRQVALLRRQHARRPARARARLRRGAARDPARPRARGADVVALLGRRRRRALHAAARRPHPRLDHPRARVLARRRGRGAHRARPTTSCRRDEAFLASTIREVPVDRADRGPPSCEHGPEDARGRRARSARASSEELAAA